MTSQVPTQHTVASADPSLEADLEWFAAHPGAEWYTRPAIEGEHPNLTPHDTIRVYLLPNGQRRRSLWRKAGAE